MRGRGRFWGFKDGGEGREERGEEYWFDGCIAGLWAFGGIGQRCNGHEKGMVV